MKKIIVFLCVVSLLIAITGCKTKQQKPVVPETTTKATTTLETPAQTTTQSATTPPPATTSAPPVTKKTVITEAVTVQTTTTVSPAPTTIAETTTTPAATTPPITTVTAADTTAEVTSEDTCTVTRYTGDQILAAKPVIYLYPTEKTDVKVSLDFDGELTCTYPAYNDKWNVTASPNGTILNKSDGKEYSYLFWEGTSDTKYDLSKGFVVKGSDTVDFLQEKLAYLGLTPKEYNEFIVYWLPMLQDNKYNLITFQGETYTNSAKLEITPKPDSMLRVFMAYKPLEESIEIEEQELSPFERKGFSVIEWGGTSINNE